MQTVMNKAGDVLRDQAVHAERIKNDEARDMSTLDSGDVVAQGDLYIVGLRMWPRSAVPRHVRQLAEGDTQGSRHIHEGGELANADAIEVAAMIRDATGAVVNPRYIGPVFRGGTIRHPEHGDHERYPNGLPCAVVFQRSLDREEREQRVED